MDVHVFLNHHAILCRLWMSPWVPVWGLVLAGAVATLTGTPTSISAEQSHTWVHTPQEILPTEDIRRKKKYLHETIWLISRLSRRNWFVYASSKYLKEMFSSNWISKQVVNQVMEIGFRHICLCNTRLKNQTLVENISVIRQLLETTKRLQLEWYNKVCFNIKCSARYSLSQVCKMLSIHPYFLVAWHSRLLHQGREMQLGSYPGRAEWSATPPSARYGTSPKPSRNINDHDKLYLLWWPSRMWILNNKSLFVNKSNSKHVHLPPSGTKSTLLCD